MDNNFFLKHVRYHDIMKINKFKHIHDGKFLYLCHTYITNISKSNQIKYFLCNKIIINDVFKNKWKDKMASNEEMMFRGKEKKCIVSL